MAQGTRRHARDGPSSRPPNGRHYGLFLSLPSPLPFLSDLPPSFSFSFSLAALAAARVAALSAARSAFSRSFTAAAARASWSEVGIIRIREVAGPPPGWTTWGIEYGCSGGARREDRARVAGNFAGLCARVGGVCAAARLGRVVCVSGALVADPPGATAGRATWPLGGRTGCGSARGRDEVSVSSDGTT